MRPSTTLAAPASTSASVKPSPSSQVQPWMSASAGSVPLTSVKTRASGDATMKVRERSPAATNSTLSRSRMAAASSRVSVFASPRPVAMFMLSPPLTKLPADTCTMLVPAVLRVRSTDARAPLPSATMAITAATPMTTPSVVSPERRRLRPSAFQAIWPLTARRRSIVVAYS